MNTVNSSGEKSGALIHVRSGVLKPCGATTGSGSVLMMSCCAIKVLLPGLPPVTVKPDDQLEGCMAMMSPPPPPRWTRARSWA